MRLLEILPDGDFRLTRKLRDSAIPRYAILSHTWGDDDEEVTFEDILNDGWREKPGSKKIEFCGQRARKDGLDYFWVDSCCINKSSDAELSESLNSMFRWYQRADKCYVYLADVSTANHRSRWSWEQAFRGSRWFTRGWTLQELLAPREVIFFSREGQRLGEREDLEDVIHEVTGISPKALQGHPMSCFEVDERMSWAKTRHTTREEDEAYSLLGIFEVSMPVIYGEGRRKALKRLRREINEFNQEESQEELRIPNVGGLVSYASSDKQKWAELQMLEGHSSVVSGVALSEDGNLLASSSYDQTVRLWDTRSGAALRKLEGHLDVVLGVALSADGNLLASSSYDQTVRLWDTRSGAALRTLEGHSSAVSGVVLSVDGNLLASASHDQTVRLWDTRSGAVLRKLEGHSSAVSGVALSMDGNLLASSSYDQTVRLWDTRSGAALRKLEGHSDVVSGVALSADGNLLASSSYDQTVRLWDTRSGAALRTLEGHSSAVFGVALSADGNLLASASNDQTVRLWDTRSGAALRKLEGHSSAVSGVALSADGELLASASNDQTVRLWNVGTKSAK